ncbi:STAS/SEC14 domain-containing protein [Hyphococcus sp.]|jgi:hypothetical protein|uniref:STAS/SEC14 domain-containing protein n=1 Tax=Hyphococcus sp. TaxID=2038636 RepID=UPI003D0A9D38
MYSLTEHHNPPYIEAVVFERYPADSRGQFEDIIKRYASQYEAFCFLEVQHGKISNGLLLLFQTGGKVSEDFLAALKKMKRMAIVSDEPGILMKLLARLPNFGTTEIRLFKLHEIDEARAWMRL